MTKETHSTKPALSQTVKAHVEGAVAEGRLTPQNCRHVSLDIADAFEVAFEDVVAFAEKTLKSWVDRGPDEV